MFAIGERPFRKLYHDYLYYFFWVHACVKEGAFEHLHGVLCFYFLLLFGCREKDCCVAEHDTAWSTGWLLHIDTDCLYDYFFFHITSPLTFLPRGIWHNSISKLMDRWAVILVGR